MGSALPLWNALRQVFIMKNKLKEFRTKRGLSQVALADAVGTTKRTIYAIESGNQDVHISLAHRLAKHLRCSIDDLFVFEEKTPSTSDKALWFAHVVRYTAEELGKPIRETIKLLERNGLVERIIMGYDVWHTQGYEYMAEMLSDELGNM